MSEFESADGARVPFKMDTEVIPKGVDVELAAERTRIIEDFRAGDSGAVDAFIDLLALYWKTQALTNGATNVYLMQASYQFPVEAGISAGDATEIWRMAREGFA